MKPLLISSGEPAGIGPDVCLSLAGYHYPIVVMGDIKMLMQRSKELSLELDFVEYQPTHPIEQVSNRLYYLPFVCAEPVKSGQLNPANAQYVIDMLTYGVDSCLRGEFCGLVTAPVHKAIINQAGVTFTGHTEFLASRCGVSTVVMMLACKTLKVALITTHLPLRDVPDAITKSLVISVITQLHQSLKSDFGINKPCILVSGLNPHAGEGGYLGREEIDSIEPAINFLQKQGVNALGPYPADTLFSQSNVERADVFVTMYHDQGLPVLKYAGFGQAVNITLGLPIVRTSVDHGTALELAGTGQADIGSMQAAVSMAISMSENRQNKL